MNISPIKEDFLHFLWRTKKVPTEQLQTHDAKSLEILDFGRYNTDSGPDFFNARIKLDGTIWAGNIEMHVYSSDWNKHGHHHDRAYENVILHVVYEHDKEVALSDNGMSIPTLALKGLIPKIYLENYLSLVQSKSYIPCENMVRKINPEKISLWKYGLTVERLHHKSEQVATLMQFTGNDWEETLYIMLSRYFGAKVNMEPFEVLARSLPLSIIHKNKDKRLTVEALLFGQAGMLSANYTDAYFKQLKKEYQFQQQKYALKPINPVMWKFSKLRPMNFPTIRIAQFAGLLCSVNSLFSFIKEVHDIKEIRGILKTEVSGYWLEHYRFGIEAAPLPKSAGDNFIDILLINAMAPVLYHYGKMNDDQKYIDKAISILEQVKSEKNHIISYLESLGFSSKTAFDSQALIHLKTTYCDTFRCLSCQVGNEIMNQKV